MVDLDALKKLEEARQKKNLGAFEKSFNEEMKRKGDSRTLDDLLGLKTDPVTEAQDYSLDSAAIRQLTEASVEIMALTPADDVRDICLRAVGLYRSVVRHVSKGGKVKFVSSDGDEKTLKVKMK